MSSSDRIAIVGIAGLFAGSPTLDGFWHAVRTGLDASRDVPADWWPLPPEQFIDRVPGRPDKLMSQRGYHVEDWQCDPAGLNLDPELLARLDPLFHVTLRTARAAWRNAATGPLDRRRVGAIFGNLVLPTEAAAALAEAVLLPIFTEQLGVTAAPSRAGVEFLNRRVAGLPAQILARALGFGAATFTIDAACASSLFALKLAADELLSGRADAMLTGGVCRPNRLYPQMGFSQLRALSPSGRCAPFDAHADGLLVGEGAGFFVLKRLEDALAHADQVYGVIAGIGLSNDTRGNLLAPDRDGQLRAMRQAYQQAGWVPEHVDLIECHATGTPVGDPVEMASLRELWAGRPWRPGQCVLGSVKANVGHTLTAAGAAGMLKVLLALRHRTLPPAANVTRPRDDLNSERSPFRLLSRATEWLPRNAHTPRRAAVSAFGFGGINAHVLIEEWLPTSEVPGTVASRAPQRHAAAARLSVSGERSSSQMPLRDDAIAVVGLHARTGAQRSEAEAPDRWWGLEQTAAFQQASVECPAEAHRLIDEINISPSDYPVPPRDLEEMLAQQLLMLQVAAGAVADAGWSRQYALRTGVFIGLVLDSSATDFHLRWSMADHARRWAAELGLKLSEEALEQWAGQLRDAVGPPMTPGWALGSLASITSSRIARVLGAGGPSFTICSEETSGLSALHVAASLLRCGDIDFAVVGAVDLPGDVRELVARHYSASDTAIAADPPAGSVWEGAVALVLRRRADAMRDGQPSRFSLDAISGHAAGGPLLGLLPVVEAARETARGLSHVPEMAPSAEVPTSGRKQLHVKLGHPAVKVALPPGMPRVPAKEDRTPVNPSADRNGHRSVVRAPAAAGQRQETSAESLFAMRGAVAAAHSSYLCFSERVMETMANLSRRPEAQDAYCTDVCDQPIQKPELGSNRARHTSQPNPAPILDRDQCLEFATGSIARALGPQFAEADTYPTRVRLPAEPLMLVDRVLSLKGEAGALGAGSIVTEHDIRPGTWYLENGRVVTCVALEAGQADLLLSAYLGADARTRGLAVYRLLDATVTFHRGLPASGQTLRYDIHIDQFFRQGDTHLFRFRYESTVDGEPLLTMTDGCAGFFTAAELAAGQGILRREPVPRSGGEKSRRPCNFTAAAGQSSLNESQLTALVQGNLAACFGSAFTRLQLCERLTLPDGQLKFLDRVTRLDPCGGPDGLGSIRAEQDIDPKAWFLVCHFVDDHVMPGTLMVEVCLQAFRVLLLRKGWVAESGAAHFEPVPGRAARLRCRGQVTAAVRIAAYEVSIKEVGFRPEPFAVADALLYADGKPIVEITDLNLRLTGVTQQYLEQIWS